MHKILKQEDYIQVSPTEKNTIEYKIAHAVKEEIRKHKWNQGTEGFNLTWEQAVDEYMEKHYNDFIKFFTDSLMPKKIKRMKIQKFGRSNYETMTKSLFSISL
jgi:hypothetical protein